MLPKDPLVSRHVRRKNVSLCAESAGRGLVGEGTLVNCQHGHGPNLFGTCVSNKNQLRVRFLSAHNPAKQRCHSLLSHGILDPGTMQSIIH